MRILIMNDLLTGGGVEVVMHQLVEHLYARGYAITIATETGDRDRLRQLYPADIGYFSWAMPYASAQKGLLVRLFFKLLRGLKKLELGLRLYKQYDIAIAMKEGPCMQRIAGCRAKKKIAWVHVDFNVMHWTGYCFDSNEAERACMQAFDHVVCVSQAVAQSVRQTVGDPGNLVVRYNPLDHKKISALAQQPCPKDRCKDKLLFVAVGRICEEKNYPMLADVCARLSREHDFELWIIGDGPQRPELEAKLGQLGVGCVKLLGQQENPYTFIRQADCFVSASRVESYGLAIQEALCLGVPVIATRCPAITEVVDDRCGIVCENSFDGLYGAMEEVLTHPERLNRFAEDIGLYYQKDELYEKRLEAICNLWEQK